MKKNLLSFFGGFLVMISPVVAQNNDDFGVITCEEFHITRPLRDLAKENPVNIKKIERERLREEESKDRKHRKAHNFVFSAEKDGELYGNDPAIIQTRGGGRDQRAPIQNWLGQSASGFRPFDPSGAAGTNYYVQAINSTTLKVFNKTTGGNVLTTTMGNIWSPATPNDGDPIIMYDRYADRWFISQFGTSGNKIYIAISTTNDPTGSYYTYTFTSPQFPDYLKFSIWADGYYMTSNQGTQKVFVFERDQMLVGNPSARSLYKTFSPTQGGGFFVPLPGDADGNGGLPTVGTPCPIFSYTDNAWGGGAIDGIQIYQLSVNWSGTPTATFTGPTNLATNAFDASYNASWNDISQPGTTQKLDGIGGVLNYRAQWRKWSGYNSVVLNWAVKISSTQRSIMWAELRQNQTTGVWSVYQQGIYTPDATYSRWCGSIAMDDNGNIALCYTKSGSSTIYPSPCYTGRLANDPLGTMTFAETTVQAGVCSQTGGINRFGDYSQTSLDPDGFTFWHTGEYMGGTTGSYTAAKTRIYSFQLQVPGPVASVSITSNDADNTICTGTSVTFTATPTNGGTTPSYQWQVNGANVGTNSPTYTTTSLTNGAVVTCIMTSNLGGVIGSPATSNSITMTVNTIPATPTPGSNSPLCSGNTLNLTTATVSGATYAWTGPSGYTSTSQNPTRPSATTAMSGTYSVTVTKSGCTSAAGSVSVTVNQTPSAPTAGSNSPVCAGTALNLTASTVAGTTYAWTGPSGYTSSSQNPTIASPTTGNTGTYSVTATANGCTSTAGTVAVTVNANVTPAVTMAITSGANPSCQGSNVTFTATPSNGGTTPTYQWTVNGNPAGTGSSFSSSSLNTGDVVSVTMTSNANCATPTTATVGSPVTMTITSVPSTPTITQNGFVLTSSSATGNQWYLNGNIIPGATSQTYTATSDGVYSVVVTINGCSSGDSSPINVTGTGVDEANPHLLVIYPNPSSGNFSISFDAKANETYTLELFDDLGQIVFTEVIKSSGAFVKQVSLGEKATGIYTVSLKSEGKETVKKIIITR